MPLPSTLTPIATTTLGSAQSSVTFSSITGSYTDLVLITNAKNASSEQSLGLRFNSDSATNYSATWMYGNGTSAVSSRESSNNQIPIVRSDASNYWIGIVNINNYSNSTTYKTIISRGNSGGLVISQVGLWRNTATITALEIFGFSQNIASGSTFTLYGVKAA